MDRLKKTILFSFLMISVAASGASARSTEIRDDFFSVDRFEMNPLAFDGMAVNKRTRRDLEKFYYKFLNGTYLLSEGQYDYAIREINGSVRSWPEYYGTDFLLGLCYEKSGDIKTAAKYYKSYLIKLRGFYEGKYAISLSIIRVLFRNKIENINDAEKKIMMHLAEYGIDLDKVRPAFRISGLWFYFLLVFVFIVLFWTVFGALFPYLKKIRRINNPPEGFWVCKWCFAENPDLSHECTECRRPREG